MISTGPKSVAAHDRETDEAIAKSDGDLAELTRRFADLNAETLRTWGFGHAIAKQAQASWDAEMVAKGRVARDLAYLEEAK